MRIRSVANLYLLIPLLSALLSSATTRTIAQPANDSAVVLNADSAWAKAAADKKLDDLMAFYHIDATQYPPTGAPVVGRNALRTLFERLFARPDYKLSWTASKVSVSQSGDIAYTLGRWEITDRNRDGQLTTTRGTYLAVWRRSDDGRWLVLEDIFNRAGE